MRSQLLFPAVFVAIGCTFGYLAASGRFDDSFAQDKKPAGEGTIKRTFFRHGLEPFEIGRDSITPIDPAYKDKGKFEFTGTIDKVTFDLSRK